MMDSDTEEVGYCKTRAEAIGRLGDKGAAIWDELHAPPKPREPIPMASITYQYDGKEPMFWAMSGRQWAGHDKDWWLNHLSRFLPTEGLQIVSIDESTI